MERGENTIQAVLCPNLCTNFLQQQAQVC